MATSSNDRGTIASNDASDQILAHAPSSDQQIPEEHISSKGVTEENARDKESPLSKDLKIKQDPILDTESKDAFPALGAGPRPQVGNQLATAWDSRKGTSVGHGHSNGTNGSGLISNASSSRASSPPSSPALGTTPPSTNALGASQSFGIPIPRMILPGRHSEKIQFLPSQLRSKDQLKKPLNDIIRDINRRSRAVVRFQSGPNGTVMFEATGPVESTRQALIDVANQVGIAHSVKGPSQSGVRAQVVNKQGRFIQQIQKQTGAKIYILKAEESSLPESGNGTITIDISIEGNAIGADSPGKINIRIRGTQKQVEDAKKQLQHRAKAFDNSITESIKVDKNHHSTLIGAGGANIREIVKNAGGSEDPKDDTFCNVRFPAQGSDEGTIQVEGNKAIVEKVVAAIDSFVRRKNGQRSQTIEVAPEKHSLLIGRDGATRRQLEAKFSVRLDIPQKSREGPARSQIKLTGLPGDIENARIDIMAIIDQESKTIQVPRRIHHALSDHENIFLRLRRSYEVTVSHAGANPPLKSPKAKYTPSRGQKSLPLITGEQHAAENYTWEVSDPSSGSQEEGVIPWVLRGPSAGVGKAVIALEKAIQEALTRQQSSTGYLLLPDAGSHRFIVGQRGSQINAIREQTGCRITIPRDQADGEAIEIVGSREEVESAKDIILDIVQKRGQRGRQD